MYRTHVPIQQQSEIMLLRSRCRRVIEAP